MLIVMDIFFFIFVPSSWMAYQEDNVVWNNLRGMHSFVIFLSVIIFLLKVRKYLFVDSVIIFYVFTS
jgi:hypothetical protein